MRDGTRAALSAAAAAGFVAVAWLQVVAALLLVGLVLAPLPGAAAVQIAVPLAIATGGLLSYAAVRALRLRHPAPAGVPVTRADAPGLWSMLDEAAVAARVPAPDAVIVVAGATAVLTERVRLAGLRGGRRELLLGLPLLQAWDEPRLRAVVAHELAHGSPALGRFAPLAYRGRVTLGRLVPRIPRRSPVGPLLRAYARFYLRVDAPVSRAQELAADRLAATFAGAAPAAAVLREAPVLDGMQQLFHAEYLSPGWQAGYLPDDIFGGFLQVLAARHEDAAMLRALPPEQPTPWDPHPPLADRLAALAAVAEAEAAGRAGAPSPGEAAGQGDAAAAAQPAVVSSGEAAGWGEADSAGQVGAAGPGEAASQGETEAPAGPGVPGSREAVGQNEAEAAGRAAGAGRAEAAGPRGAAGQAGAEAAGRAGAAGPSEAADQSADGKVRGELVPDLRGLGRALQDVAFPPAGRTVVGWDEFFGVARTAEMEREADASLRSLARVAGTPVSGVAEVLDLAADGRLRKIAETVFGDIPADETTERIDDLITLLFALAALHSGVATWRHSWTGAAGLVAVDGSHLDLAGAARLAGDPATVGAARERLAEMGIDLAATASDRPPARVPVLGGVVNVLVDGARTDLLVVETGLFLVAGLPRNRHAEAKRRLSRLATEGVLADGSPAAIPAPRPADGDGPRPADGDAARAADGDVPSRRFVPFTEVATASVSRGGRRAWEMRLRDGGTLSVRAALDSDELPGGWTALDDAVEFLARTR